MRTLLLNKKINSLKPIATSLYQENGIILTFLEIWYLLKIIDLFSGHPKFLKKNSLRGTAHPWPSSKSKFNLKSDRVNIVAPASPIECLLYLPNDRAIQYKLGPERLTRLGYSNLLRLAVRILFSHKIQRFQPQVYCVRSNNLLG